MRHPRLRRSSIALLLCSLLLASGHGIAAPESARVALPHALEDWQAWVLQGQEFHGCPFLAGGDPAEESDHLCAWPERLQLSVDAHGGHFAQHWQVYAESWVALPGDKEHWPQDVQLDAHAAPLVDRDGVPSLRLSAGNHAVSGSWSWDSRPESLAVPAATALLDLSVDGANVAQPEHPDGRVALGAQRNSLEPRQLDLQVYRLIEDDEPLRLQTRVRIRAAGDAREESLGTILPAGFMPLSLDSPLPARLDRDGALHVQVRPGTFELTLSARQADPAAALRMPATGATVREEIWSFAANDRLRVVTVEGAPGIDPAQAQVPAQWRGDPAFRLGPTSQLRISERSRGLSNIDQNRLRLRRVIWLDFDHEGWTVQDQLIGTMRQDWRLEMRSPYELESARSGSDSFLITRTGDTAARGIELRTREVELTALARITTPFAAVPAAGWTQNFESVSGELRLPPGHRLIAVLGADTSPTAWLDRWGLWNLFGVLVVIVLAYWIAGWRVALLGALGLLLTYQAKPELIWGWGNLLIAVALARAAPAGRLAQVARGYRTLSFLILGLALIPFAWTEVHQSIYPQLQVAAVAMAPEIETTVAPEISGGIAAQKADAMRAQRVPAPMAMAAATSSAMNEVVVTGARVQREPAPLAPYAPGTLVQAGPGIPSWNYGTHPFGWTGPVDRSQTVRFVVLGPFAVALWRVAGVLLIAALFVQLARTSFGLRLTWPDLRGNRAAPALLLLACLAAAAPAARAQSVPDAAVLNELRTRLTEPPRCAPTCADLLAAQLHVNGERIQVEMQASALALVAVALPSAGDRWQIDSVTVDGKSSLAVAHTQDEGLWVPLEPGIHTVRLEGRLAGENIHLTFPMAPKRVTLDAPGWTVAGINAGRLLSGALDLTRQRSAQANTLGQSGAQNSQEFPAFVRVVRDFRLDLDWSIKADVQRVAPTTAAFTVALPLVPGEAVLTEGLQVNQNGTVAIGFAAGEDARSWDSSLKSGNHLSLQLPALPAHAEVWRFFVSPQWRVQFSGMPATLPDTPGASQWVFEYHPRPGDKLDLTVSQPLAVAGATFAIDAASHSVDIGRRAADETVELRYRSTQGGRQTISIPKEAVVSRVAVDGQPVPMRPEGGELALSVLPGAHGVEIAWRTPAGVGLVARPGAVDLHSLSGNVQTTIALSADRWPLFALGRGVGPAFLYWGELLVFLVVALVLGRSAYSPLKSVEWLLLGLGLSTLSWSVLALVAVWLFAMRWRERTTFAATLSPRHFDLLQVVLAALTVVAVTSLVFSGVRYGLLASPDMGVVGPGSSASSFTWFVDRTTSALPQPTVYSAPMWVYRAIMFAWALWIALALARWLRFAWGAWTTGGYWRADHSAPRRPAPQPAKGP